MGRDTTATDSCDQEFLIVAGVTKAGTSSFHSYLAAHPDICASQPKELHYFLPASFPLASPVRYERDPLSAYLARFKDYRPGQVRMEASPGYFLLPEIPELIRKVLPRARSVILLREPISRLISYHQTATLFGGLPRAQSFDDYVGDIRKLRDANETSPWHTYPLDEGLYTERIRLWQQIFGADRVMTSWFDDLKNSPRTVVSKTCLFAGVDPDLYTGSDFKNVNPAREVRNEDALNRLNAAIAFLKRSLPQGSAQRRLLATVYRRLEMRVLYKLVTRRARTIEPSPDTIAFLRDFYAEDVAALASVAPSPPPWAERYAER